MTCTANSSTLSPRLKEIEEILEELKMNLYIHFINLLALELFYLILAYPVYKM
jgi:hypothetical protein